MPNVATWIFQANPNRYDIHTSLRREAEELWNCNQHFRRIRRGDRVLVWISGEEAGIYAFGYVLDNPILRVDSTQGMTYWTDPRQGRRERPRVCVRYKRAFLDRPLLKSFLQCDPELWGLSIFANPRGTNFEVKDDEWEAIRAWIEEA